MSPIYTDFWVMCIHRCRLCGGSTQKSRGASGLLLATPVLVDVLRWLAFCVQSPTWGFPRETLRHPCLVAESAGAPRGTCLGLPRKQPPRGPPDIVTNLYECFILIQELLYSCQNTIDSTGSSEINTITIYTYNTGRRAEKRALDPP